MGVGSYGGYNTPIIFILSINIYTTHNSTYKTRKLSIFLPSHIFFLPYQAQLIFPNLFFQYFHERKLFFLSFVYITEKDVMQYIESFTNNFQLNVARAFDDVF